MAEQKCAPATGFYDILTEHGVEYFCGVPDSITAPFSYMAATHAADRHVTTANEGNAVGLAVGYHIVTGKVPLVYMQNSGLANAVEPLASVVDRSVFGAPMILLIGWRGKPGEQDEPQHTRQGAMTTELLQSLDIPFAILSTDPHEANAQVEAAKTGATEQQKPHALLVAPGVLGETPSIYTPSLYTMTREEAARVVLETVDDAAIVIAGIGKISREVFEYRTRRNQPHDKDLLVVGGMGHASSIALGIAQQRPETQVFCIEGDGSVLMHMGALATIGTIGPANFNHIVINNQVHDSVGGLKTAGFGANLREIAKASNYEHAWFHATVPGIVRAVKSMHRLEGPSFLEIGVRTGSRPDLGRPRQSPQENKAMLMKALQDEV